MREGQRRPHFEVVHYNAASTSHLEGVNDNLRRIYDTYYEMTFGDKARFPDIGSCMTTPTPTHCMMFSSISRTTSTTDRKG